MSEIERRRAVYAEQIAPIRVRYQRDFAELEARWVHERQAVIDRVESFGVPELAQPGVIDFLSGPVDARHQRRLDALFGNYQRESARVRQEVGL